MAGQVKCFFLSTRDFHKVLNLPLNQIFYDNWTEFSNDSKRWEISVIMLSQSKTVSKMLVFVTKEQSNKFKKLLLTYEQKMFILKNKLSNLRNNHIIKKTLPSMFSQP